MKFLLPFLFLILGSNLSAQSELDSWLKKLKSERCEVIEKTVDESKNTFWIKDLGKQFGDMTAVHFYHFLRTESGEIEPRGKSYVRAGWLRMKMPKLGTYYAFVTHDTSPALVEVEKTNEKLRVKIYMNCTNSSGIYK